MLETTFLALLSSWIFWFVSRNCSEIFEPQVTWPHEGEGYIASWIKWAFLRSFSEKTFFVTKLVISQLFVILKSEKFPFEARHNRAKFSTHTTAPKRISTILLYIGKRILCFCFTHSSFEPLSRPFTVENWLKWVTN